MNKIKPLKIGKTILKNNLFLAPMAGYTDIAFRQICREMGAGLTTTEMVSSRALVFDNEKTKELMSVSKNETPSSIQLFGSNPRDFDIIAKNGVLDKFDLIDINMGCPMPKIVKNGDGSALMGKPDIATKIVETLYKLNKTVTVKVRLGIIDKLNAVDYAKKMQDAGASLVCVHGRTAKQLYTGDADWDAIGEIANKLTVPVVGNGDIVCEKDAIKKLTDYPVKGIMIGRAAITNANIFARIINEELPFEKKVKIVSIKEIILKHMKYCKKYFKEKFVVASLRKHFAYSIKSFYGSKELKLKLMNSNSLDEIVKLIKSTPLL